MKYAEARKKFIDIWENHADGWGISRSMARLHALLLISPDALSTEEIMEELEISRGNANMNLRTLIDWGLIRKEHRPGERKEYFSAEKDIWKVARQVIAQRRKRELEPLIQSLVELRDSESNKNDKKLQAIHDTSSHVVKLLEQVDQAMEIALRFEEKKVLRLMMRLFR